MPSDLAQRTFTAAAILKQRLALIDARITTDPEEAARHLVAAFRELRREVGQLERDT